MDQEYMVFYKEYPQIHKKINIGPWNSFNSATRHAVHMFTRLYPKAGTHLIYCIDTYKQKMIEYRYSKCSMKSRIYRVRDFELSYFHYRYPQISKSLLVYVDTNKAMCPYVKYFSDIYSAYEFMKCQFWKWIEETFGTADDLMFDHHVKIFRKSPKNNEYVDLLYNSGDLHTNLKIMCTSDLIYFDIALVRHDTTHGCLLCDSSEVMGHEITLMMDKIRLPKYFYFCTEHSESVSDDS